MKLYCFKNFCPLIYKHYYHVKVFHRQAEVISMEVFNRMYQWPWGRIGVYLIGMMMAYALHVYERKYRGRKLNKVGNYDLRRVVFTSKIYICGDFVLITTVWNFVFVYCHTFQYLVIVLWAFAIGLQWAVLWGPFHYVKTGHLYSGQFSNPK